MVELSGQEPMGGLRAVVVMAELLEVETTEETLEAELMVEMTEAVVTVATLEEVVIMELDQVKLMAEMLEVLLLVITSMLLGVVTTETISTGRLMTKMGPMGALVLEMDKMRIAVEMVGVSRIMCTM